MFTTVENNQYARTQERGQYSFWQIVGIWLSAGIPMWVLGWLVYGAMDVGLTPMEAGTLRIKLMTLGLIWEFVLAMVILYHEEGNIRLSTISRRFRLNHPVAPTTGETRKTLWWWIVPLILFTAVLELTLGTPLVTLWTTLFPFFAEPKGYDASVLIAPEMHSFWVGAWDMYGLFFVMALFNTFLGEEFLFRGVLLPKMEGVFGKWDWVANGIMFSFYHLHQPWGILAGLLPDLTFAFSAKHFRTSWFSIILHSGQSVFFLVLLLGLVLGLA